MTIKRTLTYLVAGGLALIGSSCAENKNYEYAYSGKIGNDQVESVQYFRHVLFSADTINKINVFKKDGMVLHYVDLDNNLKLDFVIIYNPEEDKRTKYTNNDEIEAIVLNDEQKNFDNYLRQIKEIKIKQQG